MIEEWVEIKDYPMYLISNKGRCKSKERYVRNGQGIIHKKEKILKPSINNHGYLRYLLYQDGKQYRKYVHRLVADAFIPNPENKPCINHIDCNPKNNAIENLEWCTAKENSSWMMKNNRHGSLNKDFEEHHRNGMKALSKSVIGKSIITGEEIYFEFLNDVKKIGFQPSCVCNCCKGIRFSHAGYTWRYASE